jgi:hypothetical protein
MDAKITKQRLSRMLSYDWVKIIGVIVAICIVWSLVFTMTATRITTTQQFKVYNYAGNRSFSNDFIDLYNRAFDKEFSYEIIEIGQEELNKELNTVLEARFSVGEGDLMFLAHAPNKEDSYTVGEGEEAQTYYRNYTETFAYSRIRFLYSLDGEDGYFKGIEKYLSKYFFDENGNEDWENGELNEEKAKADFRARVKKDKRFKTEAQLLQGEKDDIARLNSYQKALKEFYGYYAQQLVKFETVKITDYLGVEKEYTCYLNLNPSTVKTDETTGEVLKDEYGNPLYTETVKDGGLTKYLAYYEDILGKDGKTEPRVTSKNMCVGFLTMDSLEQKYHTEEGFECEALIFVNMLIKAAHGLA